MLSLFNINVSFSVAVNVSPVTENLYVKHHTSDGDACHRQPFAIDFRWGYRRNKTAMHNDRCVEHGCHEFLADIRMTFPSADVLAWSIGSRDSKNTIDKQISPRFARSQYTSDLYRLWGGLAPTALEGSPWKQINKPSIHNRWSFDVEKRLNRAASDRTRRLHQPILSILSVCQTGQPVSEIQRTWICPRHFCHKVKITFWEYSKLPAYQPRVAAEQMSDKKITKTCTVHCPASK